MVTAEDLGMQEEEEDSEDDEPTFMSRSKDVAKQVSIHSV